MLYVCFSWLCVQRKQFTRNLQRTGSGSTFLSIVLSSISRTLARPVPQASPVNLTARPSSIRPRHGKAMNRRKRFYTRCSSTNSRTAHSRMLTNRALWKWITGSQDEYLAGARAIYYSIFGTNDFSGAERPVSLTFLRSAERTQWTWWTSRNNIWPAEKPEPTEAFCQKSPLLAISRNWSMWQGSSGQPNQQFLGRTASLLRQDHSIKTVLSMSPDRSRFSMRSLF